MGHGRHRRRHDEGPAPFGTIAAQVAGLSELADEALSAITVADLREFLVAAAPEHARRLLSVVRLGAAGKATERSADMLLRTLRNGEPGRRRHIRLLIAAPWLHALGNVDRLDAAACARLLDPATAPEVLDRAPALKTLLRWTIPDSIAHWCLLCAIEEDRPLAPVALALLGDRPAARSAWNGLVREHPALPAIPIDLPTLRDLACRPPEPHAESECSMTTRPSLEELAIALDELRGRFALAAEAADRTAARLRMERRPDDGDVRLVTAAVAELDDLRARIDAAAPGLDAASLPELLDAVRGAMAGRRQEDRVRALRGLTGPDAVAEAVREVRAAAVSGDGPGLAGLAELIEVTRDAPARAAELAGGVVEELPERWQKLVYHAIAGQLSVTDTDDGGPDGPGSGDDPGPVPDAGPPAAEEPEAPVAAIPEPERAAAEPDPAAAEPSEPSESEPSGSPVASGGGAAPCGADEDGLVGLDAFLEDVARKETAVHRPSRADAAVPRPREAADARGTDGGKETVRRGAEQRPDKAGAEHEPGRPTRAETAGPDEPDRGGLLPDGFAEAEAAALRAGRFGLAGWLRRAAGRPGAEVDARWCAGLAVETAQPTGLLSSEFVARARHLDARALADDPAGGVLAWAAAIRAGLVYPEATRPLESLNVVVSRYPVLRECGEAFMEAARSGVHLSPGTDRWVRGAAGVMDARRGLAREAGRLLEEAPHRTVKLPRATEVWKALVARDGELAHLLRVAAADDAARAAETAARVVRLRGGDGIERLIDETDARINRPKKGKRIIAGARNRLYGLIDSTLHVVGRWATVAQQAGDHAPDTPEWLAGPLQRLRETIGERRPRIDDALAEMAADGPGPAAAAAVRTLLESAFALLDGEPLPEAEPVADRLLNRDLLLAAGLPVDPRTFAPDRPPTAAELTAVAADGPDWTAAFEARAARFDHVGTDAIVAVVQMSDADAAARLRARRDELVGRAREDRVRRVEAMRDQVARSVRDGLISPDRGDRIEEALRGLTGDRDDFDRVGRRLDELAADLDRLRAEGIARLRSRLAGEAAGLDPADVARIERHIDADDLITAREFLAQLADGRPLPARPGETDFVRFYPAFPEAFHHAAMRAGGRARKYETGGPLTELQEALIAGREVHDRELETLLRGAGISIPALREPDRRVAGEGLRKWLNLRDKGQNKTPGNLRSMIDAILKMVGLEGRQGDAERSGDRQWIDLEDVKFVKTKTGVLLPAFGTQMSPSGQRLTLLLLWGRPGSPQLIELLKERPEGTTVLVLYFGVLSRDDREQLARATLGRPAPVAGVLDDAAIGYLACRSQDWAASVAVMAPFTATNPYAPGRDVPEEMFFGRSEQLRSVTDPKGPSFVYGGRQLGKSALLRKAERHILDTDPERKVILDNIQAVGASSVSMWPQLADRLAQEGVVRRGLTEREPVVDGVKEWIRSDPRRQLLILLDEADRFLNQDADGGRFEDVIALRNLMLDTDRRVKVVWAGLHQTARFESLPNQPLAHLGTPIAVGPLDPQDAFDLLVRPLATLGYTFPETLAARVIAESNNAPALVQLFAEKLLARLRGNPRPLPYEITREDVAGVWRDKKLMEQFQKLFDLTLNLDKRYKVIAYAVALQAIAEGADTALTVQELRDECRYWWADGFRGCTGDDFQSLLDECVNLGVLGTDGERYRLRTPHILTLLGGERDVENVLQSTADFEDPEQFDAHSYRMVYRDGPERSPLSLAQLTGLLRPRPRVHVVAGSAALHVERVAASMESAQARRPNLTVQVVRPGERSFDGAVRRARMNAGHDVIVVDLQGACDTGRFERRLAEAATAVEDRSGQGTLAIVLVTGPASAPAWARLNTDDDVRLVGLRRFDAPAVRQWMWEDSLGFPDDAGQRELVRRTGGWPTLVGRVVTLVAEHAGDADQTLDHVLAQLWERPQTLLEDTGVQADECIAAAWRVLCADGEELRDSAEGLAALLSAYGEDGTPMLTPGDLATHGYTGTHDLVEALQLLGALVPGDGGLCCEPVLAEATRLAHRPTGRA
ncbi:hypothetical protein AB0L25_23320 [Spirillospora sp. NPDC052242]